MRFTIIILAAILSACGGGDPEDNPLPCEAASVVVTGGVLGVAGQALESAHEKECKH